MARFILGVLAKQPKVSVEPQITDDGPALALVRDGQVTGVVNLLVNGDRVTEVAGSNGTQRNLVSGQVTPADLTPLIDIVSSLGR